MDSEPNVREELGRGLVSVSGFEFEWRGGLESGINARGFCKGKHNFPFCIFSFIDDQIQCKKKKKSSPKAENGYGWCRRAS